MGIYLKNKNWHVDYYLRGKRKRKKVGPSKKLAEQILKDIQVKIVKAEFLDIHEDKKTLFEDYAQEYLCFSKANKAFSTFDRGDKLSIKKLSGFFAGRFLYEITPQMIEKYKVARLEEVGPASVNRELACLKHMFTKAIDWEYLKRNPVKGIKMLKEPPGRLRYLEPNEIEVLLSKCSDHLQPIVITAVNTGMRKSEILNLKWTDLDLKNRKIIIRNSKNNTSRIIPINQTLYDVFLHLKEVSRNDYVFVDTDGHHLGDIKKGFTAALRRAMIQDFRFHDLRHTFGSHLVMQGVDLRTIQQILGHKDIKMTMRYSHLSPAHVQEAVTKLDNLWSLYGHQGKLPKSKISTTALLSNVRP
jgi:integrase